MEKYSKSFFIYIVLFMLIIAVLLAARTTTPTTQHEKMYTYAELIRDIRDNKISLEISINSESSAVGRAKAIFKDGSATIVEILNMGTFMSEVNTAIQNGLRVNNLEPTRASWIINMLPGLFVMVISVLLLLYIFNQMQGGPGGGRVMSFGRSRARVHMDDKNKITFSNVAGLEEEKAELEEIVSFLKEPKKFVDIGARIPKGVLLVGPPGTGKTYLTKAVAGEAGVPFFSISGSDFVEMFVGVGASRVRDLFEQAKKNCPCIVFIDEIDAVGRRRGAGLGGGHDEREQTLNQLLVEMDGFGVNEGVIIIAATNRADILDPALLRPGRFDRRVMVNRPDVKGREEVLKVHCKGKVLAEDVDLKVVAQTTSGFTPADLENLMNEAALLSARYDKPAIDMEEIRRAFVKVGIGTEKKSRVISDREKKITAYHEAGHAVIHELMPDLDATYMVSIIPTGPAGGYTMPLPGEDRMYITKSYFGQEIVALLGGRAAESIKFNEITTGASSDIERATTIARNMVTRYGMSDSLGPMQFGDDSNEVFIGRDLAHARNYGENVATQIDLEIKRIIDDSYNEALCLVEDNMEVIEKIVAKLIEHERITGTEIRKMFPEGVLKNKVREGMMVEGFESRAARPGKAPGNGDDHPHDSDEGERGQVVDVTVGGRSEDE